MNPIFPLNEYVPDGEAHIFGDRVYLYGSHDRENGTRFCEEDYVVYSADVHYLSHWTFHGVSYRKSDDPRSKPGKPVDFYAPDVCQGKDGRYYLYYFTAGPNASPFGPLSVAVSDAPEGPFDYLGDICYPDGTPMKKFLTNDPAVINDGGHIYLYYGWGLNRDFRNSLLQPLYRFVQSKLYHRTMKEIKETEPAITSCAFLELEDDMRTVKRGPIAVLDSKTTAERGTPFYDHCFYEAPSIRHFNDLYYLVYSSGVNGELCYATSPYPDHGFVYRGVLISASDIGFQKNGIPHAFTDTNHGSIECIHGEYYLFYHRLTRNTNFSRQTCIEKLHLNADGSFDQVQVTMQGASEKPLPAKGKYSAAYACNIYRRGNRKIFKNNACITGEKGNYSICSITDHTIIAFKYFEVQGKTRLIVRRRGASGTLLIRDGAKPLSRIPFEKSEEYQDCSCVLDPNPRLELTLEFETGGKNELLELEFTEEGK